VVNIAGIDLSSGPAESKLLGELRQSLLSQHGETRMQEDKHDDGLKAAQQALSTDKEQYAKQLQEYKASPLHSKKRLCTPSSCRSSAENGAKKQKITIVSVVYHCSKPCRN
jgi:hypothetical protein